MDSVIPPEPDLVLSPELVLVDPDLARLARERLSDAPRRPPSPRMRVVPAEITAPPEQVRLLPRRPAFAARAVGAFATVIPALLLGGVAVGMVASEVQAQLLDDPIALVAPAETVSAPPASAPAARTSRAVTKPAPKPAKPRPTQAPRAAPPALSPPTAVPARKSPTGPAPVRRAKPKAARPAGGGGGGIPTRSEVEARTLVLLQERVALWVPAELLDRKTNLLVDNVQVACRQVGQTRRFDCRLGTGRSQERDWLLTVVVAKDGSQKLTWRGHAPPR